ncbi:ferrous iron transport protein B [Fulvitalea axinellae]|uniref:Ferrous iron transport protein B n=1 Tax=Fulvitalea axinellae TaxID=1182444 RepID=A0AAU9D684_9BACT|nr:ferrous iron transport protein B [Fulvitalea axinellae]
MEKTLKVGLVGNPNAGKSSVFNHLTGLSQKIGNYPGVTVDKKYGFSDSASGKRCQIVDLPGTYSIYPRSADERVVIETLSCHKQRPDLAVVMVDASNLKRNLLLCTQIIDMGLPVVVALTMTDMAEAKGLKVHIDKLSEALGVPVVPVDGRSGKGCDELKHYFDEIPDPSTQKVFEAEHSAGELVGSVSEHFHMANPYMAYQYGQQYMLLPNLDDRDRDALKRISEDTGFDAAKTRAREVVLRYSRIAEIVACVTEKITNSKGATLTEKIDRALTHKVYGYAIFFGILFLIFQAIYKWATIPMDLIDGAFADLASWTSSVMPEGPLASLLADGLIPGIGGVVIFVPQIAILFGFISLLEESGYMARVVFLMDKVMRKFGLNGRSVVPLISGAACAIPGVMATRSIENPRDRLITIMVTPLMSCSARLPVYAILIALVVPETAYLGFNLQGITLMGLYIIGFLASVLVAWVFSKFLKTSSKSILMMELPDYRIPRFKNVGVTVLEKSKTFVFEAGKIIMAISVILWALASYGPSDVMEKAEDKVALTVDKSDETAFEDAVAAYKLEHSYAGILGKSIEPLIEPLGYDWKIGIALVSSFAAREVFVGTMATIYSVGSGGDDEGTVAHRMAQEINPDTGGPRFTPAVGFSLLLFYAFAMQCMSTLAIVKRETKSWKWPAIQFAYMTALAYGSALLAYHAFS